METVKAITKKLESLNVAKSEAQAKLQQILVDIDQKKAELGDKMVAGKTADMKDLDALNENKTRQELVLTAIDVQVNKAMRDLEKAKEAEYQAELEALRDEGKKQLVEMVKTIDALYKMSAVYLGFERKANTKLTNEFGRGGLSSMGVPVQDIFSKTDFWLGRSSMYNKKMMELLDASGVSDYMQRKAFAEKEYRINAKV